MTMTDQALSKTVERAALDAVFLGFEHGQCEAEWEPAWGECIASAAAAAILRALQRQPTREEIARLILPHVFLPANDSSEISLMARAEALTKADAILALWSKP